MKRNVKIAGHTQRLYVTSYTSSCGNIQRGEGVAFQFENEGCWVVPLAELEAIVAEAKAERAKR